jgi:prophage regulatory protein
MGIVLWHHIKDRDMKTKTASRAQQVVVARHTPAAGNRGQQEMRPPGEELAMLRKRQVLELTTWSNSTLYNRMREGFPSGVRLGPRRVAWPAKEVYAYLEARVKERDARVAVAEEGTH